MPTALEQLLARIAAERGAPLPEPANSLPLGPLSNDTSAAFAAQNPEPVPPAFARPGAVDQNFVNTYTGAEPVRPVERRPGKLETIMTILGGIGAGMQGNGPAYVESIRRQRQAPFERYERQREQFEDRRARGIELSERRAEREAEQANRMNELAYERDFKLWLQKNGDRSDEAKQRMAQMFTLQRDANAARLEEEREQRRERRQRELDARQRTSQFFAATKDMALSQELGAHYAGTSDAPLSNAAAALDRRLQRVGEVRMSRGVGGGGGTGGGGLSAGASKALANFNAAKQQVISAIQNNDVRGERLARRRMASAFGYMSRFPRELEAGGADTPWPYGKPRGQAAPAPGQQPQSQFNLTPQASPARAQAKAKLIAVGYSDAEAEQELNRLGIQ